MCMRSENPPWVWIWLAKKDRLDLQLCITLNRNGINVLTYDILKMPTDYHLRVTSSQVHGGRDFKAIAVAAHPPMALKV